MTDPARALPAALRADLERVRRALAPYTDRAYFVGGVVRDFYLGRACEDADIEVYDIPPEQFEALMEQLGAKGVGKSFFVYKIGKLDLCLPRHERLIGPRHQDFEVTWCNDPLRASRRRDFTINALMINIFSGEPLDFHGGLTDLNRRQIAHIDDEAFCEDALRVLRAARFSAQLNFKIAAHTAQLCQQMSLQALPADRIRGEIEKLFSAPFLARGLYALMQLRLDRALLGVAIGFKELSWVARSLRRIVRNRPEEPLCALLLPWLLIQRRLISADRLCSQLGLSKRFFKALKAQPRLPVRANSRFLLALSLRLKLARWPGLYLASWQGEAQRLGVFDRPFSHGVCSEAVLAEGFKAAAIGQEIRRRISSQIRKQDGKPLPTFN